MATDNKRDWLIDAAAIWLGAFLMFLIQPLVGKIVTPQYGGVSQVWSACLMFFQITLLLGYGFTFLVSRFALKTQAIVYTVLLGLSALVMHIPLGMNWAPPEGSDPLLHLLKNLFTYVSLPCILLATVSTMLQNWYGITRQSSPYYLYSISNVGSMLALLVYPTLVEPTLTVSQTVEAWGWGYRLLIILILLCSIRGFKWFGKARQRQDEAGIAPVRRDYLWWVFLSACGTVLLISMTHYISDSLAPVPMLWILPLAVYLLSFILTFSHEKIYHRRFFLHAAIVSMLLLLVPSVIEMPLTFSISLLLSVLFLLCMVCHGEIYHRRPQRAHLPGFYFAIAAGGALGGILVNLAAPMIFDNYIEFPLILLTVGIISLLTIWRERLFLFKTQGWNNAYVGMAILLMAGIYSLNFLMPKPELVLARRNFYGSAQIYLREQLNALTLTNGTTLHGLMLLDVKTRHFQYTPTTYYVEDSAVGIANRFMRERRKAQPLKIGVVGLGIGTIAAYGQPGDEITFFEIDPKIVAIARENFRFLADSKAQTRILMGDGRLTLTRLSPQQYDVLVIDAFNSDSIPVHLLTREALAAYLTHLKPDGLLLFHISNSYLQLQDVIGNLAVNAHLNGLTVFNPRTQPKGSPSLYGILSRDRWFTDRAGEPRFKQDYPNAALTSLKWQPRVGVWADDYSNLFSILN
ncbi:MAG TPA: fused MFS/spermidine synthase [Coleofasciculaceae cyanobacterium]|jgi:hypothetical protein